MDLKRLMVLALIVLPLPSQAASIGEEWRKLFGPNQVDLRVTLPDGTNSTTAAGKAALQNTIGAHSCLGPSLEYLKLAMRSANSPNLARMQEAIEKSGRKMRVNLIVAKKTVKYVVQNSWDVVTGTFYPATIQIETWSPSDPKNIDVTKVHVPGNLSEELGFTDKADVCDKEFRWFDHDITEDVAKQVTHAPGRAPIDNQNSTTIDSSTSTAAH